VPSITTTFLLLGVPAIAWAAGATVVMNAASDLRAQDPLILPAGARGRLVTYLAVTGTTVIFGLIPWLLVTGIESDFGPPAGSMALLIFWLAISFAWTAVVATAAQVWVTQTRLRSFVGLEFARVLPLVVIPNTLVIFGLVLCFLTLGRVSDPTSGWAPITNDQAGPMITALLVYAASTVGLLISTVLASWVKDLTQPRKFVRALSLTEGGVFPAILAIAWAFLQLSSV